MAKTYTYDDFKKALAASGLSGQFSDADLRLAEQNPDAGMSILSYKQDYANATTDEARALANAGANAIRESYGKYTAGTDGSGFYMTTGATKAPTATNPSSSGSPSSFIYNEPLPEYKNTYGQRVDDMLSEILKIPDFSYDHTTDPLYSSYKKTYTREGKRATADALGQAATATGGIPSSYAVSAASQAGNYYAAQLADKVPELYQMAYDKYLHEYQMKLNDYEALQDREQFEYSKYLDEVGRYENDRNFNYAQWLDELDARARETARLADERNAALSEAYAAAEYGDFSKLQALGINPDFEYLEKMFNAKYKTDEDKEKDKGGISQSEIDIIKSTYPDGVVTDKDDWNDLVSRYGEEALKDAGITKGDAYTPGTTTEWTDAKINDVRSNVAILVDMMNKGDDEIKTVNDIKSAMLEVYPQYANDAYFATLLNQIILELTKKTTTTSTSTKNTSGGGGGKINAVSMGEVR